MKGPIFSIQRPSFLLGALYKQEKQADGIDNINKRNGLGNFDIERNNFDASKIKPRLPIDFEKLQAIDIETQGAKIQLSQKTLDELFKVKVPDITDTQWIDEKNRMVATYTAQGMTQEQIERELQINKPLGREQRTTTKTQNIAQSSLSTNDKLNEIKQEVEAGRAEGRTQQAALLGQLALILADTNAIDRLTQLQLNNLSLTLMRLNIPRTAKQLGLEPRFVDIDFYNANAGMINLFIFSRVQADPSYGQPNGVSYQSPVKNFVPRANGLPPIQLNSMVSNMGLQAANRRYLDLQEVGVISYIQMTAVINNTYGGNWDNPDVSVAVAHR